MMGPRRGDLMETKIQRDLAKGKGTGTRGSFIGLRMPTAEEILLKVLASMAEN